MKILFFTLTLLVSNLTHAHFLWLEKAEANTAKLYFGEWQGNRIENREKLKKFSAAIVFGADIQHSASLKLNDTFFSGSIDTQNDVHMQLETLPARENRNKEIVKTAYYAKIGRQQTTATLPLELVPTIKNGNTFSLLLNGKPLIKAEVIVYGPPKWEKHYKTDQEGKITIETPWQGQYIFKVSHKIPSKSGNSTMEKPSQRLLFTNTFYVDDKAV